MRIILVVHLDSSPAAVEHEAAAPEAHYNDQFGFLLTGAAHAYSSPATLLLQREEEAAYRCNVLSRGDQPRLLNCCRSTPLINPLVREGMLMTNSIPV